MANLERILGGIDHLSSEELQQLQAVVDQRLSARMTEEERENEFEQELAREGVLTLPQPRDPNAPPIPRFEPVVIEGEPLSETIIRERR